MNSATDIRLATSTELPRAVSTIVAAFIADPPARFAWPSPHDYLQAMPLATRSLANRSVEHGSAYVTADLRGAAFWFPPGVKMDGEALEKLFRETAKREHLGDLLATFEQMDQSHPQEPHWYLLQVGVDPTAQGKGLGDELMRHALALCDQQSSPAYLEASKPANIPFYRRHGFEVMREIQIGRAPPVIPMLRPPRNGNRHKT